MTAPLDPYAFLNQSGFSGVFVVDAPMSRLAADVYAMLEPYSEVDAANGYALRSIVEAMTKTFVDVDELVRDSVDGKVGWSKLLDATRAPPEALPWLGQLVGVTIQPVDDLPTIRARVGSASTGIRRGSLVTMKAAAQLLLIGTKTVLFFERVGDAWHFSVRTRVSETPSSAAVLAALTAQKPAGLILDYTTYPGLLYMETTAAFASYTATQAAKATYTIRSA